jgi:hypothetical protein
LAAFVAFYPAQFHCTVDSLTVRPQPSGFYAGSTTPDLAAPFKDAPGIEAW